MLLCPQHSPFQRVMEETACTQTLACKYSRHAAFFQSHSTLKKYPFWLHKNKSKGFNSKSSLVQILMLPNDFM